MAKRKGTEVVAVEDFSISQSEEMRLRYAEMNSPLDELTSQELEELTERLFRYTPTAQVFDRFLFEAPEGIRFDAFIQGLEYLVTRWMRASLLDWPASITFTVNTAVGTAGSATFGEGLEQQRSMLISNLVESFRDRFGIHVELVLKKDVSRIFHARFLVVKRRAVMFDPGFDLFTRDGRMRKVLVSLNPAADKYLQSIKDLPTV